MNELAVPQVDAHVAEGAFHRVEEHQVTRLEFRAVYRFGDLGLLVGPARQDLAHRSLEHGAHQTRAVEPGFCAAAAVPIGHTHESHGVHHQFGGPVSNVLPGLPNLRTDARNHAAFLEQSRHVVLPGIGGRGLGSREGRSERQNQQETHRGSLSVQRYQVKRSLARSALILLGFLLM